MNLKKRIVSGFTSLAMCLGLAAAMPSAMPNTAIEASAAGETWKFDFGNGGTQSGYTGVSASAAYSSSIGYGFNTPGNMSDVAASGSGALSDAVQFKSTDESNTFNMDLPTGLYQVTVYLGNTNRTSVKAENMLQIINMTGNNAVDTFQIPITDGQLNIMATKGKAGYAYTMSALEITRISNDPTMKPTIWLCGDSTVCNYYPLNTSVQGGWGQMLNQFVDTNKYEIRNMAASGQYAKGFVDAGQFKPIEYYGKKGDYYIISIGINDTNYSNETEYYETVTSMVTAAKAKGMEVILVKQQGRNGDATRNPLLTGRWFGGTLDKIGTEQNVQVIDLFNLWQDYCISIGTDATTALYMDGDGLHPKRAGAIKLAELAASQIAFGAVEGAVMDESAYYMFKNVNSGLYMEVEGGKAAAGTNVQQWGADSASAHNTWHVKAASDGYYYILSMLGDGQTYYLDLDYGKTDNGTNIGIYTDTQADAQLFKFADNGDGTYTILTKSSGDASAVEIINAETASGANVQQWEVNGHNCQKWYAEKVNYAPSTDTKPSDPIDRESLTATPVTKRLAGDADCSDALNISDVTKVMSHVNNPILYPLDEKGKANADVYQKGDGISNMDALEIQKAIAQISTISHYNKEYYSAIDASYTKGVTESYNAGFESDEYINLDNEIGSSISWVLEAEKAGNYYICFKVSNGGTADRQMKVEVNGGSDYWMQSFVRTSSWTEWIESGIVLPLEEGKNIITLTSATENGGPNFDYVYFEETEEPIAEIYVPEVEEELPTEDAVIYIAGDSTVQSYRASYAPQQGWGYYLGDYFADGVTVSNHSLAGRSSKSFYDQGRLQTILDSMKKGDYLFVQFGINDSAYNNAERYAPVCGNVNSPTEGSFEYYLEKYITGALEKGGTPVMVTTVIGLKAYSNGKFVNSYTNYCQAMKDMAAKYSIPCIDLNSLMVDHYNSIGYDAAYYYHLIATELSDTDMTHFTETGANAVAGLVANAIKGLGLDISSKVK